MASKIEIISAAFTLLGKPPINDIGTSAPPINLIASNLYDIYYKKTLTETYWRFSVVAQALNQVVGISPVSRFKNVFQLPTDPFYLTAIRVEPATDYEIYEDKIYTNQTKVTLEYVALLSEDKFPPYFETLMIETMAFILAMPITQNAQLMQIWQAKRTDTFREAQSIDAKARPNNTITDTPFISAHNRGGITSRVT